MLRLAIAAMILLVTTRVSAQSSVRPGLHWSRAANASTCIDPRARVRAPTRVLRPRSMLRFVIALLLLFLAESTAAQSSVRPALHWSRATNASTCIDPRALALRVGALTGDVLVEPASATLSIEGHIEAKSDGGFRAHVTSSNAQGVMRGERIIEQPGSDCRQLDSAIAFVIALLIDPDLTLDVLPAEIVALGAEGPRAEELLLAELEQNPAKPYAIESVEEAAATTANAPRDVALPRSDSWLRYELSGAGVVALKELPNATIGAQLGFAYRVWRSFSLEALLRATAMPRDRELASGYSVSAQSYAGTLLGCGRYPLATTFLEGCVGPELSLVRAAGHGFSGNRSDVLNSYGMQLAVGGGLVLTRQLALRVRVLARYSPTPARYHYVRGEERFDALEVPSFAIGTTLGVSYAF